MLFSSAAIGAAAEDQLSVFVGIGYDSNPYKISSPEAVQGAAEYKVLTLNYQGDNHRSHHRPSHRPNQGNAKKANLRYRLGLQKDIYNRSSRAADNSRFDGHLRWIGRFKFGEQKANLMLSANIRSERNTYFSQTQRQIAETSEGDSIDNRFSFDAASVSAELVYYADKKHSWSLLAEVAQRNYREDYKDVGLEAIDFNEFRLQPSFRYKAESGANLRLFIYHKSRDYSGLFNDLGNRLGNALESKASLLEYSLNGYGAVFSQALNENLDSSFYLSGYFARDNGQGSRDLDYHRLTASLNYRLGSGARIDINAQTYWRGYLNQQLSSEESETGSSGSRRKGLIAEFVYSQPLVFRSLRGMITLRREVERNSIETLEYRRQIVEIGLQYQL